MWKWQKVQELLRKEPIINYKFKGSDKLENLQEIAIKLENLKNKLIEIGDSL